MSPWLLVNANWLQGVKGRTWQSQWSLKKTEHALLEGPSTKAAQGPRGLPSEAAQGCILVSLDLGLTLGVMEGGTYWIEDSTSLGCRPFRVSCCMPGEGVMGGILSYIQSRSPKTGELSKLHSVSEIKAAVSWGSFPNDHLRNTLSV